MDAVIIVRDIAGDAISLLSPSVSNRGRFARADGELGWRRGYLSHRPYCGDGFLFPKIGRDEARTERLQDSMSTEAKHEVKPADLLSLYGKRLG